MPFMHYIMMKLNEVRNTVKQYLDNKFAFLDNCIKSQNCICNDAMLITMMTMTTIIMIIIIILKFTSNFNSDNIVWGMLMKYM